ncbi:M23 family metallopeptidase [Cyanobium gracile]|uniref:M23 family metallopeptidase n=1 Tax=Cyanobium gracile UHCC 0281 TaxID=3110309 RepID=A0ABU5SXD1_9CYAN|nr:M23 family metallopeptidase [Cyanobium gracile]MEA5443182.1 M23 family metallopeptidase [Cyanobium gracile UHCC 0281]
MAPKPLTALTALTAGATVSWLAMPLVLAQAVPGAEAQAPPAEAPDPAPVLRPSVRIAAPVTRPEFQAPVQPLAPPPPVSGEAPPATLRPGTAERRPEPVRRFDASLDALVREGVVTPGERVRVRGSLLSPQEAATRSKACRAGALSVQECNSGVIIIGRGRKDGLSDGLGEGDLVAGGRGIGFGGFGLDASPLPPITVPVSALLTGAGGSFRLTDVFRVTPRPAPIGGNGNQRLLFPLIGSAVTTSNFGWRLHPVIGSWLMHAGRDLAAPEGTPVVAALSGRVVSSGLAGGYGLAVEIEHDRPRRRTLYGHLSELYVKDGEMVRQGEVIGRVGSTGLSTGPHLHFELRLPEDGGWVATDPGDLDPGGSLFAGLAGPDGRGATDAVALLMGQLIATLERPRSPLPLPGETLPLPAGRPSPG